jgi:serine protease inhibitor
MRSFSVDLYRQLAADGTGDIAFSPVSISAAFSLVWAGARGKTAEELQRVLHKERNAAIACGYDFVVGVSTEAHKQALLDRDPELNIVVTGCPR